MLYINVSISLYNDKYINVSMSLYNAIYKCKYVTI